MSAAKSKSTVTEGRGRGELNGPRGLATYHRRVSFFWAQRYLTGVGSPEGVTYGAPRAWGTRKSARASGPRVKGARGGTGRWHRTRIRWTAGTIRMLNRSGCPRLQLWLHHAVSRQCGRTCSEHRHAHFAGITFTKVVVAPTGGEAQRAGCCYLLDFAALALMLHGAFVAVVWQACQAVTADAGDDVVDVAVFDDNGVTEPSWRLVRRGKSREPLSSRH